MRLVKLTNTKGNEIEVNPEDVRMVRLMADPNDSQKTVTGLMFRGDAWTYYVQGTPAEVARLLAGGEGDTIERTYLMELANLLVGPLTKDDFFTGPDLIAEVKSRAAKAQSLTAEVERLKALIEHNSTLSTGWLETLKRERDEARAALGNPAVIAAIRLANAYVEFEPGDDATELDNASFAYERLRDEAPASPAPEPEPDDRRALLETALRALVLTHQYAPETLPPIAGWEWYDAARKLAAALPGSEWAAAVPEPAGEVGE